MRAAFTAFSKIEAKYLESVRVVLFHNLSSREKQIFSDETSPQAAKPSNFPMKYSGYFSPLFAKIRFV